LRLLSDLQSVRDRYSDLVAHSPNATVYQTTAWLDVWKHLGAELAFVEVDRETMLPFVLKGRGAWRRAYSLPFDTYGGPVTPHPNGPVEFENAVAVLGRSSARVVDYSARMVSANGAARRVSSHVVDVSRGYEAAQAGYTDANRRLLRQGIERGVRVEATSSPADMRAFHRLHLRTVARHGARPLPRAFFDAVLASLVPAGLATVAVARHDGAVIAANLVLRYGQRAYDWMWVYDDRFLHLRATNALIDHAIREEATRGAREMNLGASPNDRLGSVRFKQSFGAVPFEYTVYAHTGSWVATARRVRERMGRLGVRARLLAGR
jgi:hypothetical protein